MRIGGLWKEGFDGNFKGFGGVNLDEESDDDDDDNDGDESVWNWDLGVVMDRN